MMAETAVHVVPLVNPGGVTINRFGEAGIQNEYYKVLMREYYLHDKADLSWKGY